MDRFDRIFELNMDILKYGKDVEVLKPSELRREGVTRLQATLKNYMGKRKS